MNLLYIDTTGPDLILAASTEEGSVIQHRIPAKRNHSEALIKEIDQLLTESSVQKSELDNIVVQKGPGSFTGTRVGVAAANALAYALKIELVGVKNPNSPTSQTFTQPTKEQVEQILYSMQRGEYPPESSTATPPETIIEPEYSAPPNITTPKK